MKIKIKGGSLQLKRVTDGKIIRLGERVLVGAGGAAARSRERRWVLPGGEMNFFAPRPA